MKQLHFRSAVILLSILVFGFCSAVPARAQEAQDSAPSADNPANVRVARLSFFYGSAQVRRPDLDWQDAQVNLPLEEGFEVRTEDGRAEIQFDDGPILRLAQSTTVHLAELNIANGNLSTKIEISAGSAILEAKLTANELFRVATPNLEVEATNASTFRVDATEGNSWITVLTGNLQVTAAGINSTLSAGNMLHFGQAGQPDIESSPASDDFDTWSVDRDRMLANGYAVAEPYVAPYQPEFYNAASDLSAYGYWGNISGCGSCWMPYGVSARWMPFGIGSWCYFGNLGWTWISAEPWGWLPYHYGKWFHTPHGWAWSPNPVRRWNPGAVDWMKVDGRTAWAPAGTFASRGSVPGAMQYVTGREAVNGVIRLESGSSTTLAIETPRPRVITSVRPPAPSLPSGSTGEATPAKTIIYDPSTHSYVNGDRRTVDEENSGQPHRREVIAPYGEDLLKNNHFSQNDHDRPNNPALQSNNVPLGNVPEKNVLPNGAQQNAEAPKSGPPLAARPQFGPPSGYAAAGQPAYMYAPGDVSAPAEEVTRPERAPIAPVVRPATGSGGAAPVRQAPMPTRSTAAPVQSAAPRASAPAPTAHASSGTPHH